MRIGIDIEEVKKFKLDKNDAFLTNNFTKKELDYAFTKTKPEQTLCGIFCAKEAIIKSLDNQAILFKKIEIKMDASKKLFVVFLDNHINSNFIISISHCKNYAVANAIRI